MCSGRANDRRSKPLWLRAAALLTLLAAGTWVAAQYRVNTRVNNGLYGAGTYTTGSVRAAPYQTSALPSQTRHAYWSSGMSRSDVRTNYAAMGPMASGGAISYVTPSRSREAVRGPLDLPPPSSRTPSRQSLPPVGSSVVTTAGRGGGTPVLGSVTYSTGGSSRTASPNTALGAGGMSTAGMSTGGISRGGPLLSGSPAEAGAGGASQASSSLPASSSANNPGKDGRSGDSYNQFNSLGGASSGSSFDDLYSSPDVARSGSIRYSDPSR
jgi:hypothetical protein